jgi:hypothetical protein
MRVSRTLAETLAPAACTLASWLLACACGSGRAVPPELADEYDAGTPAAPVDASFGAVPTGPTLGDAGCATGTVQAQKRPAYLLFVQDASGSMSQEHKWEAVVPALTSMFADMTQASDPSIAVGLIVFPGTGGPYPASNDVPVGYVDGPQEAALDQRLAAALANSTPTYAAIQGGYAELEAFQAAPPLLPGGKKILVLITDGVPTDSCNGFFGAGGYTDNPCVLLATQEDGKAAPQGPIETFVIGVGPFPSSNPVDFDPLFLGSLASAGGAAPATCNPVENANASDLCYLEVDPTKATSAADLQAQITAALDAIRGQVASCAYTLKSSGLGQVDPTQVNVVIDGQTILQDPVNGWTYDDPSSPTEIVLHGASCNQSTATATANVSIVLGCATQTLL